VTNSIQQATVTVPRHWLL